MRIEAFNPNHDELGRFAESGGGGGLPAGGGGSPGGGKENPIASVWRRQASKMSTPKLKRALDNAKKFANATPNEADQIKDKVIRDELARRGAK